MALLTLPGLIDPHVHLRDPGQEEKEDFYTGTSAALHGGFTMLLDMPNNVHPIFTKERLEEKMMGAKEKIVCDIGFYFGSIGDNLEEFNDIYSKTFGLKLFLNHTTGDYIINQVKLQQIYDAWQGSAPILLHAEENVIEMVIEVVKQTNKKTHICHVASKFELEKIIEAKEANLPITCGVTPQHLFLTEKNFKQLGPMGLLKPPLKSEEDREFLWKHLRAIDVIESDHAPHTIAEKHSDNPPYGVPGLETTLPLLLTEVAKGKINIEEVIRLCHDGPAKIFGLPTDQTTQVILDTDAVYEIKNDRLLTKCKWSPFTNWKVRGRVQKVILRGKVVMDHETVLASPGSGHLLTHKA
jgi:dihydroorotase (multifunctional complex type)